MEYNGKHVSERSKIYTASICITNRCNCRCTYCHFYDSNAPTVSCDMDDEQFLTYLDFINAWCKKVDGRFSYRFSGGDPSVLGDRLFELANTGFRITNMRPFVLTSGKDIDERWVRKAKKSAISHVFVSIENPAKPDPGAPNPEEIMHKIKAFNSPELPIVPGVCVVPNDCFSSLYEICKWFFENLEMIPLISEVNFGLYASPTEEEWKELEKNVYKVIRDFFHRAHLNLFSSVAPEYAYGGNDPYIFDLGLNNPHEITDKNIQSKIDEVYNFLHSTSYRSLNCLQEECPWVNFCQNTKWYWQIDKKLDRGRKLHDYCRLKRMISDAFYQNLVDSQHLKTERSLILG